jgi:dTDP-4-dehydrorhamnose reductase
MKKVVVLGSTGMAGHVVALYLEEQGYDVYRASRSQEINTKSISLDVCDFLLTERWLDQVNPDIVINCIGLLQRASQEQPNRAVLINSYLPHWLESKYAVSKTRVIHLSTDCVFSGKRGNYKENDFQDGDTLYDRSKALGEINNDKDLTLRMSIIGPDIDPAGTGLFNWFMKQSGTVGGYTKVIWNGITTIELSRAIDAAISKGLKGLYQLVPLETIDKYSLLCLFQNVFNKNDVYISKDEIVVLNKSLLNTRRDFDYTVKGYREQIEDMKTWVENHKRLYPHYRI